MNGILLRTLLAVLLLCPQLAHADLSFTVSPLTANALPGETVEFQATLINTSSADRIELLGASGVFSGPSSFVSWDDTAFLNNLPSVLEPGGHYDGLLSAIIETDATTGLYDGRYSVDGNVNGTVSISALSSVRINITPAPSSLVIGLCGAMPLLAFVANRNKSHCPQSNHKVASSHKRFCLHGSGNKSRV